MNAPLWHPLRGAPPEEIVLRLLAYFDVFGHPLSRDEILRFGFGTDTHGRALAAIDDLVQSKRIATTDSFYHLPFREDGVPSRRDKARRAHTLWSDVPSSVAMLNSFPFVRGLSITGTLAKDAVGEDADIDYVVFAAKGRVWICRTLISLARKLMTEHQRERCCTNVFLSEHSLGYDQQTPYVAAEIGLSRPVLNPALGRRFFQENDWLRAFFPGLAVPPAPPIDIPPPATSPLKQALEAALSGTVGNRLEATLPLIWERFWALKYGQLSDKDRKRRFRIRPDLSTNHYNNFQARVLERYNERLTSLGLAFTPADGA